MGPKSTCYLMNVHNKEIEKSSLFQHLKQAMTALRENQREQERQYRRALERSSPRHEIDLKQIKRTNAKAFMQSARFFFLSDEEGGISFLVRSEMPEANGLTRSTIQEHAASAIKEFIAGLGGPKGWSTTELTVNNFIICTEDRAAAEVVRHLCENLRGLPPEVFYAKAPQPPSRQTPTVPPQISSLDKA